jgi:hypothetical protein
LRRYVIGLLFLLGLAAPGWAQSIAYNDVAWTLNNLGYLVPAGGAQVDICNPTDIALPCTNHVSVFRDSALSQPITQPFFADLFGNVNFFIGSCGPFSMTITGATVLPKRYQITPCGNVNGVAIAPSSINGIVFADGVTNTIAAACTAAGTTHPMWVTSTYPTNEAIPFPCGSAYEDFRVTATNSNINSGKLYIRRVDNSPPVSGAGILNAYLAPEVRIDLIDQSGTVTGSRAGLLVYMPSVLAKEVTTITQSVTGSGVSQSISVADSSVFSINDVATVDLNKGNTVTEQVTLTAIPDSTHVTGIFTKNHANGAKIYVATKGDKIALGVACGDHANTNNTANIFCQNLNITAVSPSPHWFIGSEIDVTNSMGQEPGSFVGDNVPFLTGLTVDNAGNNSSSDGVACGNASGSQRFLNCYVSASAKNYAFLVAPGPNGSPTTGISVQGAATNGIAVGSNQTPGDNPNIPLVDPTNGLYLTGQGSAANASSNTINLEAYDSSAVKHNFVIQHGGNAKRINFIFDAAQGMAINFDGTAQTFNAWQVRDSGTNTVRGNFAVSGTSSILTSDVIQTNGPAAALGTLRLLSGSTISWRNNANSGDVPLAKNSSDQLVWPNAIVPSVAGAADLGATALPYGNLWLGTAATNNFRFAPAATSGARVVTVPDPGGAVNLQFRSGATTTGDSAKFDANGNVVDSGSPPVGFTCVNVTPVTTSGGSVTTDQNMQACTIPANTLNAIGKTLMIQTAGVYSTPAASTTAVTLKVKLCSVSGCATGNVATLVNISSTALAGIQATNDPFNVQIMASTTTAGASSAAEAHGNLTIDISALTTAAEGVFADGNTATIAGSPSAIDLTAQNFLQISVAFSVASASNVATGRQLIADVID